MQKMEETNSMMLMNKSKLPESPRLPMEFLSRSWSLPAFQLSKTLSKAVVSNPNPNPNCNPILEEEHHHLLSAGMMFSGELQLQDQDQKRLFSANSFSFASSATSQLVLDRIMSQSEVSPMTSGRPSCSDPPNGIGNGIGIGIGGQSFSSSSHTPEMFDSPTSDSISPPVEFDKFLSSNSTTPQLHLPPIRVSPTTPGGGGGGSTVGSKTVGRWLKERKEKKKEESRIHNAQLHAAISVAAVAAAVAATTSATAAIAGSDEAADVAIASAATLVAARCVEAAEAMGAEREQLAYVIGSAVNVQSHGDIMTLTAAAATALRGAATLKARTMKEVCNIAAVLPVEKGLGFVNKGENCHFRNGSYNGELLSRGSELLKRTRKGELHLKIVSVYIDKTSQVILKMKSRHVAGTITKKKKKVLMDVCKDLPTWPERRSIETRLGDGPRYFGLKTATHRVIQFECKTQQEYESWTEGVSRLLSRAKEQRKNGTFSRNDMYWG